MQDVLKITVNGQSFDNPDDAFRYVAEKIGPYIIEQPKPKKVNPLNEIGHRYHLELVKINGGSTWSVISRMTVYLMGYKYVKEIPEDRFDEARKICEDLCVKTIRAFKGSQL